VLLHCPRACSNSPKSLAKLRRQVRRTKEVLSANTFAPITVEELHDGKDFQSTIKREEFDDLAGDFWDRAAVRDNVMHVG
jgi:hypoxia up-regulated 1